MTGMVGSDLEQMRALAAAFERAAAQLNQTSQKVRNGIQISAWVGPFAVRFRRTWESEHSVKLRQAAAALSAQARQLRLEADQQDKASSASPGSSTGGRLSSNSQGGHPGVSHRDLVDFARSGTSNEPGVSIDGYTLLTKRELEKLGIELDLHDQKTGFDAKVYRDTSGRVVVAFGGTEGEGISPDVVNDLAGVNPLAETPQAGASVQLALALKNSVGAENLVFTGHSLGGRNAALASVATGAPAVTFNAAGVGAADYLYASTAGGGSVSIVQYVAGMGDRSNRLSTDSMLRSAPEVTNYSTHNDPLSLLQDVSSSLLVHVAPTALGDQRVVGSHQGNSHSDWDAFRRGIPAAD